MHIVFEILDRAFAQTPYPGDEDLTVYGREGRAYDNTWKLLHGKNWREMPVYEFITGDTPIPDLTPKAFHYYLPALLKASLTEELAGYVLHTLTFYLNPAAMQCGDPTWDYRIRHDHEKFRYLLTELQLESVRAVFQEWHESGCIDDAEYQQLLGAYPC